MKQFTLPKSYDTLNDDQKIIFNQLVYGYTSNQNYFLTGDAGVGKSYVIDVFVDFCKANSINVMKTAPTGVAATNIKGITLHKAFKLPLSIVTEKLEPTQFANIRKKIMWVDVLFIDEISMCRIDMFNNIMRQIMEANKIRDKMNLMPIQVIISGDFGQLQPVVTDNDKTNYQKLFNMDIGNGCCYASLHWVTMDFKPLLLTTSMRQSDKQFCQALDNIKIGVKTDIDYLNANTAKAEIPNGIWLCGYNKTAATKNAIGIYNLPGQLHKSKAIIEGNANINHTTFADELLYKEGARVIMVMRDTSMHSVNADKYHNGSLGTIRKIWPNGNIEIDLDNGYHIVTNKIRVPFMDYDVIGGKIVQSEIGSVTQYPFKIGYAITIHKSQGQTYDQMNLVPEIFAPGQLYVALSRCKDISKIYIQPDYHGDKITEAKVIQNLEIIKFLINVSADAAKYKRWFLDTVGMMF